MKISYIVTGMLMACAASTTLSAQTTKSVMVDSMNQQLQRGATPPKSASAAALKTNAAAAKFGSGANTKPARVVQVPAITTQARAGSLKSARAVVVSDSGTKAAPPVMRSAKVVTAKPPAR